MKNKPNIVLESKGEQPPDNPIDVEERKALLDAQWKLMPLIAGFDPGIPGEDKKIAVRYTFKK